MERSGNGSIRDPIPPLLADSLWLGGEAMVAPNGFSAHDDDLPFAATDRDADPSWQVI